jgi:type III restriction enzyme
MKIELKDFQELAVEQLVKHSRSAGRDIADDPSVRQTLMLASPTGSGKTVIATAWMERVLQGDGTRRGDADACFLWITDQPELNEQTRRKILAHSSVFGPDDIVTIDATFDQERFDAGKIYFLNIQKIGKEKYLVTHGDKRDQTIWETITNSVADKPASFWVVLDEAHKGMAEDKDEKQATTIVQKFIKGSDAEIPPIPLIFGISATPKRFQDLISGTGRTSREHIVAPEDVRASGLLKDNVVLWHPETNATADWSMLRQAAEQLADIRQRWVDYAAKESAPVIDPILVVQVEDAGSGKESKTDLIQAITIIESALGALDDKQLAHAFQERMNMVVADRTLRYVPPSDIEGDPDLRVVFFKRSLNTGWDCPRAEVMMSFRTAVDHTAIAQLIGRMVRTPLARRVTVDEVLNSVGLYLPFYDRRQVQKVVDYLSSPSPEDAFPSDVKQGAETFVAERDSTKAKVFAVAENLPTYIIERVNKASNVRRLMRLGRQLAYDKLDPDAPERFRTKIIALLDAERARLSMGDNFQQLLTNSGQVDIRAITVAYGQEAEATITSQSLSLIAENIDDLHAQSGRQLGEGLHGAYLKARVAADGSLTPAQVKLELCALLQESTTADRLQEVAGQEFKNSDAAHKAAIRQLPEERRQAYNRLRRQAARPEPEDLTLPDSIQATKDPASWAKHIYVPCQGGEFQAKLNSWESDVISSEIARDEVLGWYRNPVRKPWSLTVPYDYQGETKPAFPDFVVFRRQGGGVVPDILEPHRQNEDDAWAKVKGLADYAQKHGDHYGRICYIAKVKAGYRYLDVNDSDIRSKVLGVLNNQHLMQLVEAEGTNS